ncbi:MAG: hypothetical protein IOC92_04050 [Rhodobacter sp.]|nr:hypothetical protein [Rhodobacter sp.]MCA3467579.1 hypothetical protein [Rhodobacter sp.]MCA3473120.1 hypothetical protein [Rhodobacter sp.]MCA3483086.1 hypothetical protein [Rhodobacter sp.]MCA3497692.1 hypothetical protein [Rhodobacter sp.]
MASAEHRLVAILTPGLPARAVCDVGTTPSTCGPATQAAPGTAATPARTGRTTGAEAQVPKLFTQGVPGLWAGCPPSARVRAALPGASRHGWGIIRNDATGRTVTATLLGRKRANPGPSIQVSSDTGRVGGLPARRPAMVLITALCRQAETPVAPGAAAAPARTEGVETDRGDAGTVTAVTGMARARAGAALAAFAPARGSASGIQPGILIFGVKARPRRTVDAAPTAGSSATARKKDRTGKTCQSIAVNPAADRADSNALVKTVNGPVLLMPVSFPDDLPVKDATAPCCTA